MIGQNNKSELRDLLDSDDELPTNYKEEPELPAYLDDQRFDAIQFNWIKNDKVRRIAAKPPVPAPVVHRPSPCYSYTTSQQQQSLPVVAAVVSQVCSNQNLIKKGILNEEDILCMKSVAAQTSDDEALLWFIDFLMHKDLQADYRFLKSCLVITHENSKNSRILRNFPKNCLRNNYNLPVGHKINYSVCLI